MKWPWQRKPVEERATEWGTSHLIPSWGQLAYSSSGVVVSPEGAAKLSAVAEAIRQPAVLTAGLPLDVYDVSQDRRVRTLTKGSKWQNRLLDRPDSTISGFQFWSDLSSHVDGFGNAYAFKVRDGGRVAEMWLLDPARVQCEVDKRTRVRKYIQTQEDGTRVEIPAADILHVRGWDPVGTPVARSPAERHRDSVGKIIARGEFEDRYLRNDARPGVVLMLPENVTRDQAAEWLDLWNARHQGAANAGKANVIGGGGDIKTIPVSLRDSQFIEAEEFSIGEIARMYDWMEALLGSDDNRAFVEIMAWTVRIHLMPRLQRIEGALGDDADLFGATSKFRPYFDVSEMLRGDAATMATVYHQLVQVGVMKPNEARIPLGLPPLPEGDVLQQTPVGGAPNTPSGQPPAADGGEPPEEERSRDREIVVLQPERDERLMRRAMELAAEFQPTINIPAPVVNVPAPVVNVAAPEVTVTPAITVESPDVIVNVPEQAPPNITVNMPRRGTIRLVRDEFGRLKSLEEED